jgi:diguanylate cyclase (GGDEF)-like protein
LGIKFRSIGTKIQLLAGTAIAVGLAAVLGMQTLERIETTWSERMDANLRIVKGLAAPARVAIAHQDKSVIDSYMELLSSDPRAAAIVLTSNEAVMASRQSISHFDLPIVELERFSKEAASSGTPRSVSVGQYEFIAVPVKDPALRTIGTVAVAWDTKGLLDNEWESAIKAALSLLAVMAGVLSVLLLGLRNLVISPISRIAERLQGQDLANPNELATQNQNLQHRSDEIGVFARALGTFYKNTAEKVQLSGQLDSALSNMSQGLCMFDSSGQLVMSNARFAEMYQIPEASLKLPMTIDNLVKLVKACCKIDPSIIEAGILGAGTLGADDNMWLVGDLRNHLTHSFVAGATYTVSCEPTPDGGWVTTHSDVSELKRAERQLIHLASHDPLTNLPNRRRFLEIIKENLADKEASEGFAVFFLDLDKFKQVNDTLGHAAGDELLKTVAERLLACLRQGDSVCRLGGDEFAILQKSGGNLVSAEALAQRITKKLCEPVQIGEHQVKIGISTGIALSPRDGATADSLLHHSDLAVYVAKNSGRNTYRFYDPEMSSKEKQRDALEADLKLALARNELELHYQPILDLKRDEIVGCEALLRWNHPTKGTISPLDFVPLAEETGLIVPIGEWVLREACRQAASWPTNISIAVNVSALQLQREDLSQMVFSAIANAKIAPSRLHLEITEGILLHDNPATLEMLSRIRGFGVQIVLDDLGIGYSSLGYLSRFKFDKIKIDRSFLAAGRISKANEAVVQAIVSIGRSLGVKTVVEGVETAAQRARVFAQGIDEIQGFLISKPQKQEDIARMLPQRKNQRRANKRA